MGKTEKIQRRKLISSYGGSGSIIETYKNGSLLVLPYNRWGAFGVRQWQGQNEISCPRLIEALRNCGYPNVTTLREIPLSNDGDNPAGRTLLTERFPKWFYCSKSRRLLKLDGWRERWERKFGDGNTFNNAYPSCEEHSTREGRNRFHRCRLIQIRFVMASINGELADVPFDRLFDAQRDGQAIIINNQTPSRDDLTYHTSSGGDGLYDVSIKSRGDTLNLATIYGQYIVVTEEVDGIRPGAYRMLLKGATNLYYPKIMSCIQLPEQPQRNNNNQNQAAVDVEQQLRMAEYDFLADDGNFPYGRVDTRDFCAIRYKQDLDTINVPSSITAITCLKEVSVLTGYTRIMPFGMPTRWYDMDQRVVIQMRPSIKRPFAANQQPIYMPAVESYGEGLFFNMTDYICGDNSELCDHEDMWEVYMHTYCHALMKELEFVCGYPVTSLRERLYVDRDTRRFGFLIYTIAGAEGSYGGLASLQPSRICDLVRSAKRRAINCPNDPICSNEEQHCFACVDLPETSCERFNNDLNHRLLLRNYD